MAQLLVRPIARILGNLDARTGPNVTLAGLPDDRGPANPNRVLQVPTRLRPIYVTQENATKLR